MPGANHSLLFRLEDADSFIEKGAFNCARAIFAQLLSVYPSDEAIWIRAAEFEKDHGTQFVHLV